MLVFLGVAGGRVAVNPISSTALMDLRPVEGCRWHSSPTNCRIRCVGQEPGSRRTGLEEAAREALSVQGALIPPVTVKQVTSNPPRRDRQGCAVTSHIAVPEAATPA